MEIKPIRGYIFITPYTDKKETSAGIYIGENKGRSFKLATIQIVEQGTPFHVGDTIIYNKNGEDKIEVGSKEYTFITEEDIVAVCG